MIGDLIRAVINVGGRRSARDDWFASRVVLGDDLWTPATEAYADYVRFSEASGQPVMTSKGFAARMRAHCGHGLQMRSIRPIHQAARYVRCWPCALRAPDRAGNPL